MSHHYIKVSNLSFSYPDGNTVFEDISFNLEHGDSLVVLGENGSGKTTLIKHFNGTILPQKGEIDIGGTKIAKHTLNIIRSKVGVIFQNTDNQLFMPTVYENIAFGLESFGHDREQIHEIVIKTSKSLLIEDLLNKHPFKLSGGQKRKVCIASILAASPDILVLDEPTAELDPRSTYEVSNLLKDFKHTKIIATHNLQLAQKIANKALILKDKKILYFGPIDKIFQDTTLLKSANLLYQD